MGPTASGKTSIALELATKLPLEIISVDSALIYQDMNIGTAKPTLDELNSVTHHLVDIISPLENYSVAQFLVSTNDLIRGIISRNKIPVLVGGTMMYYNALLNGISELPEANNEIRTKLEYQVNNQGLDSLYTTLQQVDYITAAKISGNDRQRIIRALEVFYLTNQPLSTLQAQTRINLVADIQFLPLAIIPSNRSLLHRRIHQRFQAMLQQGFIDEVRHLQQRYCELSLAHNSMRCVGYKEVWSYLSNQINSQQLIDQGEAVTRQLAKRQITWLRAINPINLASNNFELKMLDLLNQMVLEIDIFMQ